MTQGLTYTVLPIESGNCWTSATTVRPTGRQFNIAYAEYDGWAERLRAMRVPNSGPVDRFWFKSLYFREPSGVLFELATDAPGFATDEPMDKLGTTLSLPPFLEGRREQIEAGLKKL